MENTKRKCVCETGEKEKGNSTKIRKGKGNSTKVTHPKISFLNEHYYFLVFFSVLECFAFLTIDRNNCSKK